MRTRQLIKDMVRNLLNIVLLVVCVMAFAVPALFVVRVMFALTLTFVKVMFILAAVTACIGAVRSIFNTIDRAVTRRVI